MEWWCGVLEHHPSLMRQEWIVFRLIDSRHLILSPILWFAWCFLFQRNKMILLPWKSFLWFAWCFLSQCNNMSRWFRKKNLFTYLCIYFLKFLQIGAIGYLFSEWEWYPGGGWRSLHSAEWRGREIFSTLVHPVHNVSKSNKKIALSTCTHQWKRSRKIGLATEAIWWPPAMHPNQLTLL